MQAVIGAFLLLAVAPTDPAAGLIARLGREGAIRPATAVEIDRIRAAIETRGRAANRQPFYVVRHAFGRLDALNGGNAVNFIVPAGVTIADYGTTHSNFYRPDGRCLHGMACPPCPDGASPMRNVLDATPAGCLALPGMVDTR